MAVDGTEFTKTKPSNDSFYYYNRKSVFSVKFICLTNYKLNFRNITYGFSSSNYSRVFRNSSLKNYTNNLNSYYDVGDLAFQEFGNIICTISTTLNPKNHEIFKCLMKQQIIVKNAFGLF